MIYLELYWSFLLIGFSSFGGLSMVPQISDQMLSHGWMTASQVTDIVAIAEMTPGPLGVNCATFAGMQAGGALGAVCANLGVLTPTLTLTAMAAIFFYRFRNSKIMRWVLVGVRPVCFGLVLSVLISLSGTNYWTGSAVYLPAIALSAVDLLLLFKWKVSIPKVLVFSACAGLILFGVVGL